MRDRVQERLQAWSYGGAGRRRITGAAARGIVYPLYGGLAILAIRRAATLSAADLARPLAAMAAAKLAGKALHRVVRSPRPFVVTGIPPLVDVEPDNGFPSDHALQVGALVIGAWALEPRAAPAYALAGSATLLARLGAGLHHTLDIAGGLALMGAGAAALYALPLPAAWDSRLAEVAAALYGSARERAASFIPDVGTTRT